MNRRTYLKAFASLAALAAVPAIFAKKTTSVVVETTIKPLKKTKAEWKKLLSSAAFGVLFEENTESPKSSPLDKEYREGTYVCAACFLPLFISKAKFDSGTGWPSFTYPIQGHIGTKKDYSMVWPRTEYHCIRCEGHQGHVFDDGPKPTGMRYCNNGVALQFILKGNALPALRS
jgi:peptide-methionine (R)-S-oxide reductase